MRDPWDSVLENCWNPLNHHSVLQWVVMPVLVAWCETMNAFIENISKHKQANKRVIILHDVVGVVLTSMWRRGDSDQQSGYCSFPSFLQDAPEQRSKSWISRTQYAGETDLWTRRTVVTFSGGLMRIEHQLHASCRYRLLTPTFSKLFADIKVQAKNWKSKFLYKFLIML